MQTRKEQKKIKFGLIWTCLATFWKKTVQEGLCRFAAVTLYKPAQTSFGN
jgi:hypothetical protein